MRQTKNSWVLTEAALATFLARLSPDAARAGEAYENLREALVKFLDWRGARSPEDLVDETFNRVARKLVEGETIQDVASYCHGVARFVFLQSLNDPNTRTVELAEALEVVAPMAELPDITEVEQRKDCLTHCLSGLSAEQRQLITEYYRAEKRQKIDNRVTLAARLGIPLNALRSRAQRLRDKLEKCVMRCSKINSAT